jgi:hypothetical protein
MQTVASHLGHRNLGLLNTRAEKLSAPTAFLQKRTNMQDCIRPVGATEPVFHDRRLTIATAGDDSRHIDYHDEIGIIAISERATSVCSSQWGFALRGFALRGFALRGFALRGFALWGFALWGFAFVAQSRAEG